MYTLWKVADQECHTSHHSYPAHEHTRFETHESDQLTDSNYGNMQQTVRFSTSCEQLQRAAASGLVREARAASCIGLCLHASTHPLHAATCPHSTLAQHPARRCRPSARHGTGRPALLARAFAPPKHAPKARRLAPCARLTSAPPLCRSDLTVQEEGGHRTSRARSSRRSWRAASGGSQGPAAKPRPAPAAPLPASQPPRARARVG